MSDWSHRGAKILAIEPDPSRIYHDGNVYRQQVDMTFDDETFARIRLGFLCLRCLEPHAQAFPDVCSLCGYGMAEFQTDDLGKEMDGTKHIGPSTTVDDELAMLREKKERERHDPNSSISLWTPPSAA